MRPSPKKLKETKELEIKQLLISLQEIENKLQIINNENKCFMPNFSN